MCKIIKYRYTKCWRPADAGEDYDELDPKNLCDGGVENQKLPCIVEVCDKHKDGVPQYFFSFKGYENEKPKCRPSVEFCYIPTCCAAHRQDMYYQNRPVPPDDKNIHCDPKLPQDDFIWHVPRVQWRDPGFRMVNWNPEPRKVPLNRPDVSPKTQCPSDTQEGGVINAFYDAEHWESADGRAIDLLENHYDDPDINDRPAFPRIRGPAMPLPRSLPPQHVQTPGPQSAQSEELRPTSFQAQPQPNGSQGRPHRNSSQRLPKAPGPATGDARPEAPLSHNLFGIWRESSKSRLSSRGSSSSNSSLSSSSGRPNPVKLYLDNMKKGRRGDQPGSQSPVKSSPCSTTTALYGTTSSAPSMLSTHGEDDSLSDVLSKTPISSTPPSLAPASPSPAWLAFPTRKQTLMQLEGQWNSWPEKPHSAKGSLSFGRSSRLRMLILERGPRLHTEIPEPFYHFRDRQHGDFEQTTFDTSSEEMEKTWDTLINAYQNGEREFGQFNYPRPVPNVPLSPTPSPTSKLADPQIHVSFQSEVTGRSPSSQSESRTKIQSSPEEEKFQPGETGSPVGQSTSPVQDAMPQGQESPNKEDEEDEEEKRPAKRRKFNTERAAVPAAKTHHMKLRSRSTRVATVGRLTNLGGARTTPTSTHHMKLRPRTFKPSLAPDRPDTSIAGAIRRSARTAARAGTQAKGASNTKGKAKSTTKGKSQSRKKDQRKTQT